MSQSLQPLSAELLSQVDALSLAQQVALRMVVGTDSFSAPRAEFPHVSPALKTLLGHGLGGIIFFKHDVSFVESPLTVAHGIASLAGRVPESLPRPWFGVDEEGGHITRLPARWFPVLPHAAGVTRGQRALNEQRDKESTELVGEVYDPLAFYMSLMGFNCNFAPVLDVDTSDENPVIHMRSFGADAETVKTYAAVVNDRHKIRGVLPVTKHAPGHGSGHVDSHIGLPTLTPSAQEWAAFEWAARQTDEEGQPAWPALMLAHAVYPDWDDSGVPASLSAVAVQKIRQDWGYNGVLFTDDLCMGAITLTPQDAAAQAFSAGVDVLLWRECTELQVQIHHYLCEQLQSGQLCMDLHRHSVARILSAKAISTAVPADDNRVSALLSPASVAAVSDLLADKTTLLPEPLPDWLPLSPESCVVVVEPNAATYPQYADDADALGLTCRLQQQGCEPLATITLAADGTCAGVESLKELPLEAIEGVLALRLSPLDELAWQAVMTQFDTLGISVPILQIQAGRGMAGYPDSENSLSGALGALRIPHLEVLVERIT